MKLLISTLMLTAAINMAAVSITSPSGSLRLDVSTDSLGTPIYSLDYKGKTLVSPSRLGLKADEVAFTDGFSVTGIDTVTVDRTWQPVWGEYANVRDHFRELAVHMKAANPDRYLTVRFRLFDDGLGFRYELPRQDNVNYMTLRDESTSSTSPATLRSTASPAITTPTNISGPRPRHPPSPKLLLPTNVTTKASVREATWCRHRCCCNRLTAYMSTSTKRPSRLPRHADKCRSVHCCHDYRPRA